MSRALSLLAPTPLQSPWLPDNPKGLCSLLVPPEPGLGLLPALLCSASSPWQQREEGQPRSPRVVPKPCPAVLLPRPWAEPFHGLSGWWWLHPSAFQLSCHPLCCPGCPSWLVSLAAAPHRQELAGSWSSPCCRGDKGEGTLLLPCATRIGRSEPPRAA